MWASFAADLNLNNHRLTKYPLWPNYNMEKQEIGENFVAGATRLLLCSEGGLPCARNNVH